MTVTVHKDFQRGCVAVQPIPCIRRRVNSTLSQSRMLETAWQGHVIAYIGPSKWNLLPEGFQHTHTKAAYKAMIHTWINSKGG